MTSTAMSRTTNGDYRRCGNFGFCWVRLVHGSGEFLIRISAKLAAAICIPPLVIGMSVSSFMPAFGPMSETSADAGQISVDCRLFFPPRLLPAPYADPDEDENERRKRESCDLRITAMSQRFIRSLTICDNSAGCSASGTRTRNPTNQSDSRGLERVAEGTRTPDFRNHNPTL